MKKVFVVCLYTLISLFFFFQIFFLYFQQDEWHNYGYLLLNHLNYFNDLKLNGINYIFGSGRPLAMLLNFLLFPWYGPLPIKYAFFSIILHSINGILVCVAAKRLFKNTSIAFLSGLFFLTNSISNQAVTWFGTVTSTLPETFFALLSFLMWLTYIKKRKMKSYIVSIIFLLCALEFRESVTFLFLYYLLVDWVLQKKQFSFRQIILFLKSHWLLLLVAFLYVARFVPILFQHDTNVYFGTQNSVVRGTFVLELIYNSIIFPIESLSQLYIHPQIIYGIANTIMYVKFPDIAGNDGLLHSIFSEYVSVLLGCAILGVFFIIYLLEQKIENKKTLILLIFFVLLSPLPFIFYARGSAFLESRYRYFGSTGASILLAYGIYTISNLLGKLFVKNRLAKKIVWFGVMSGFVILYIISNYYFLRKELTILVAEGNTRKTIMAHITHVVSKLPAKTIFYIQSDTAYYGQKHKTLPMQSGSGEMLMVLYAGKGQLNSQFFQNNFLWDISSQGYKEIDGQGFGYFDQQKDFLNAYTKYHLTPSDVFSFRWSSGQLVNTTNMIRSQLSQNKYE